MKKKYFTAKCPYSNNSHGEVSLQRSVLTANCPYGEVSSRENVLTAKCPHSEMSLRRSVRTAKCPHGELSYGEMSYGEKSYSEKSGNQKTPTYYILHQQSGTSAVNNWCYQSTVVFVVVPSLLLSKWCSGSLFDTTIIRIFSRTNQLFNISTC